MATHSHHETTTEVIKDGKVVKREHHEGSGPIHGATTTHTTTSGHHGSVDSGHGHKPGKLPSNSKARDVLIETETAIKDTQKNPPPQLNEQGRRLLTDVEHLAHDNRRFLEDKNRGNLIQNIANEARLAVAELQNELHSDKLAHTDREAAKQMVDQASNLFESAQQLLVELATSQTFRQDMLDLFQTIVYILHDVTGVDVWQSKRKIKEGVQKAKNVAHNTASQVSQSTREASSAVSSGVSSTSYEQTYTTDYCSGSDSDYSDCEYDYETSGHVEGGDYCPICDSQDNYYSEKYYDDYSEVCRSPVVSTHHSSTSSTSATDAAATAVSSLKEAKNVAMGAVQQGKEKLHQVGDNVATARRGVHREGNIHHQNLTELIDRLSQILYNISSRPQSRQVVKGLLDMVDMFTSTYSLQHNASTTKNTVQSNPHVINLIAHIKTFMERFAGKRRVDRLIAHAKAIQDIGLKDNDVRQYFLDVRSFLLRTLDQPQGFRGQEIRTEMRTLIDRGRKLAERKEVRDHIVGIIRGLRGIVLAIAKDPQVVSISRDIKQFIADLTFDKDGNFNLSPSALQQLKVVLVSALIERLTVAIPSISSADEKMEFEVSNIFLTLKDVVPDHIKMEYRGNYNVDTSDLKELHMKEDTTIVIKIHNINFAMRDLHVWFKRKTFPKTEDSGKLTIDMPGDGLDLDITLKVRLRDPEHLLSAAEVDCTIDKLKLHLTETHHNLLYNAFLKLASGSIKRRVATKIEEKIIYVLENINVEISRQVYRLRKQGGRRMSHAVNAAATNVHGKLGGGVTNIGEPRDDVVHHSDSHKHKPVVAKHQH